MQALPEMIVIEDCPFTRKRKGGQHTDKGDAANKGKSTKAPRHSLSAGSWSSAFCVGHKIDFNLTKDEDRIVQNMSDQQLIDAFLEPVCRTVVVNWYLAYALDKGKLNIVLKESQDEEASLKLS